MILDYVKTLLPINTKVSPSGWHTMNCPVCTFNGQSRPDTRKRGGFNFNNDAVAYHCFNCGFKTSWLPGRKITSKFRVLLTNLGATDNDIKKLIAKKNEELSSCSIIFKDGRYVVVDETDFWRRGIMKKLPVLASLSIVAFTGIILTILLK